MTDKIWTDDDIDGLLRSELTRMATANPAPALDTLPAKLTHRRRPMLPVLPWSAAPDRPRRLAPAALGLAAAVAFAAAGTWVGVHRLHSGISTPAGHGLPTPTPRPAPSEGAAVLHSTVPPGVDVVYYKSVRENQRVVLQAVSWSGRPTGSIDITTEQSDIGPMWQSPNGRWLVVGMDVFNAQGRWLGRPLSDGAQPVWSDDSRSFCFTEPLDSNWTKTAVSVYTPGVGSRRLATPQDAGNVIGCSARADRVVVAERPAIPNAQQTPVSAVVVYRMSTGAVITRHDYCYTSCPGTWSLVASGDGTLVAESGGDNRVLVRDLVNGGTVAMPGGVLGFSRDDSRALVEAQHSPYPGSSDPGPSLELVDARTGRVVWARADTGAPFGNQVVLQPSGTRVALGLTPNLGKGNLTPAHLEILDLASTGPGAPPPGPAPGIKGMAVGFDG